MAKIVTYSELKQTLSAMGAQISAAEAHGMLVGMFCMSPGLQEVSWKDILLDNLDCSAPNQSQWRILKRMAKQVNHDISKQHFAFKLLLPDDEIDLSERLAALGNWCCGYLSGLALFGLSNGDLKNPIVQELVQDISEIAHLDMTTDASEEDEHHYMELVEYLRIALQNVHAELQSTLQQNIIH